MRSGGMGRLALLLAAVASAPAWLAATPASADTLVVTKRSDPSPGACTAGDCSLREAVRAANARGGADRIVLPERGPYRLSQSNVAPTVGDDTARRGDLDVAERVTLAHPGRGRATIDANGLDRPLHLLPGGPATLIRVKLTGGDDPSFPVMSRGRARAARGDSTGDGGGLLAEARARLVRTTVARNSAASAGGIAAWGVPLTLTRSSVARNESNEGVSGGIDIFDAPARIVRSRITANHAANAGGGVVVSSGAELTMRNTTVSGNSASSSVGGVLYEADGTITGSTISGNLASGNGGGVSATTSVLRIVNSTIAGNRATDSGGGIENSIAGSNITLRSVSVVRNVAGESAEGGGLFREGGTFLVVNSLVALNRTGDTPSDAFGTFGSIGGNLLSTGDGASGFDFGTGGGDYLRPMPKLGPLARNGGPTATVALRRGSPAIGKAREDQAPARDQRGNRRDARPDIGAFER